MQAMAPTSPLEMGGEMFTRAKTRSVFLESISRPLSQATDSFDTEFEDDDLLDLGSELEESDVDDGRNSPKGSLSSVSRDHTAFVFGTVSLIHTAGRQQATESNDSFVLRRSVDAPFWNRPEAVAASIEMCRGSERTTSFQSLAGFTRLRF